jgi:hypothetical protein
MMKSVDGASFPRFIVSELNQQPLSIISTIAGRYVQKYTSSV